MSLLEDIEKLMKPTNDLPDLEEDDVDGTASSLVFRHKNVKNDDKLKPRKKVIDLSVDNKSKYGGTKISRDEIFDHCGVLGFADNLSASKRNDQGEIVMDDPLDTASDKNTDEKSIDGSGREQRCSDEEFSDDDDDDDYMDNEEAAVDSQGGSDRNDEEVIAQSDGSEQESDDQRLHSSMNKSSTSATVIVDNVDKNKQQKKAQSVHEQIRIWEQLLYVMIKVHATLRAFNQLPRGQQAKDLLKKADKSTLSNLARAHRNSSKIASVLLKAEQLLLCLSSYTKSVAEGSTDSDDMEIKSSDEEEEELDIDLNGENSDVGEQGDVLQKDICITPKTKTPNVRSRYLSRRIDKTDQSFMKFRESTLMKWDERTNFIATRGIKSANSDFSAFEKNNIVSQIEEICAKKDWLLKRSRTKKSDIERIGGIIEAEEDEEIYDDDDFYQTLLKELIDKKCSKVYDPVMMTRHYIEMKKLRGKRSTKKVIDHRASKDRKIKYIPIPKLVNFHPAMPELVEWNNESRNKLFKSLFC